MSIPAISSSIAAIGGKTALPGLGDLLPVSGLPLDFAALLAAQIPPAGQTNAALLATEAISAGQPLPDTERLSATIALSSAVKESVLPVDDKAEPMEPEIALGAENVLAALTASPRQPAISGTKPDSTKVDEDKDKKTTASSAPIPLDIGPAAQYIVPMATPPIQNRIPEDVDRNKSDIPPHMTETDGIERPGKDGRGASPEPKAAPLSGNTTTPPPANAFTVPQPDSLISPRSEKANAAILAGESNPGNSGTTPAFASALAAAGAGAANGTAASTPPPAITSPISSPSWTQDFGTRVVWMAKHDQQVAQININPPQLGPIQISISISGDQTSAIFASPHAEVRQAIQDSLPQLREMLANAGISLGQANVGSQMPSQNREAAYQFANEARSSGENAILSPDSHASANPAGIPIQRGGGLVDLFA